MTTEHRPTDCEERAEPLYSFFGPGLAAIGAISLLMLLSQFAAGTCAVIPTTEELAEFEPYRRMIAESFRAGTFPLWSPELLCGLPLAGWPHASAFYPFALFFGPLDYSRAATLALCLHVFIFSSGLLYFLRALRFRPAAASLAAIAVGFGGGLWHLSLNFLPTNFTVAWAPWLWGFAFRLESSRQARHFAGAALAFALQITAGRYDFIARELISLAVFALAMRRRLHASTVGLWLLAGLLGATAAGLALFPHAEYMAQSIRRLPLGFDYYRATQQGYMGIATFLGQSLSPAMFTAAAALAWNNNRGMVKPALVLLALALLWIGPPELWLRLNYLLPVLGQARYGNVSLFIGLIALALLTAEGIEAARVRDLAPRLVKAALACSLLFALFSTVALVLQPLYTGGETEWSVLGRSILAGKTASAWACLLLAAAIFFFRGRLSLGTEKGRIMALAAFFIVEAFAGGLTGMVRRPPWDPPFSPAPAPALARGIYQPYRNLNFAPWDQWRSLDISIQSGSEAGTRSIDGFIALPPLRYAEFLTLLSPAAMKLEDGKIKDETFMSAFKREGFMNPGSLALLEFLNVGRFFAERINFKFTPVFSLRFEQPSRFDFAGGINGAPDALSWPASGAASWSTTVAAPPGAKLLAGVEARGPGESFFFVCFGGGLQYARSLPPSVRALVEVEVTADNAGRQLFLLGFTAPLGKENAQAKWTDPRIAISSGPLRTVQRDGDLLIAQAPAALPPAFIVHRALVIGDKEQRLAWIAQNPGSLRDTAVLESAPPVSPVSFYGGGEGLEIQKYESQRIEFRLMLMSPAVAATSEVWYPGWRAWSRASGEIPLIRADHAFRAVALPAGPDEVRMVYCPESFRVGLWVSMAVLSVLIISFFMVRRVVAFR